MCIRDRTVTKKFTIANFDATGTTETDMTVTGTLTLAGGIEGLVVTLKNGTNTVGTATVTGGTASISINDTFTKDVAETHTYTVEVNWPSGSNDIDYINEANTLTLTLTGTQA